MSSKRFLLLSTCLASLGFGLVLAERTADAAPPWVDRRLTLPRHDWAFDMGMGIGHYDYNYGTPAYREGTEFGFNFEMAVAPIRHLELGFRTGIRPMDDRNVKADEYGRLFDRQTWGTWYQLGVVANPEFRVRGELVDSEIFELALEGRVYLPIEPEPRFATVFGVPMAIHLGQVARMDLGVYVPLLVHDPGVLAVSVPFDLWFQVSDKLWLGPLTNLKHIDPSGPNNDYTDFAVGFGLGYQFTHWFDLKTQILWPAIDNYRGANNFGMGVGVQFRIE